MTPTETFAEEHNLCAIPADVARIKRQLRNFYSAVEKIDRPGHHYIQLHNGDSVRAALARQADLWGGMGVSMVLAEMPETWSPKYRASVCYHIAPLLDDVVNS
ncbi:hypothetical protein I7F13_23695 [Sinorhizobium meliloti]|uniref:hypothetical protein n=1 Tax=Rhizobium meliloti TaxID=382 RepID=UPI000FDC8040|nr:hypothetical protein [Sinorhizobium meliloti]MDE3825172.1 hypothetical protein [Sinorhizobium meliloti]RVM44248.1 hypothetical protein CN127_24435 [Sinorhizobium meliloti]RVN64611.1 hypothetical protein CN106_21445 [Sinorhizobium meliloti]